MDNLQQLGNQATSAIQNQYPSLQLLRDALVKKFNTENPLIQKREAAIKDFLAAPEEIADKYAQPIDTKALDNQFTAPGQNPIGTPLSTLPIPTGQPTQTIWRSPSEQRARYSRELVNKFVPVMTLNDLLMLQGGGVESILSQANEAIKSDIEAKKYKFDAAYKLAQLNQTANGVGTLGGRRTNILNQVAQDAQSGMTLKDIMKKYSTQAEIAPGDVLRVYNSNSVYGVAKERLSELTKFGIKDTRTAEQRNRETALKPAFAAINRLKLEKIENTGPIAWPERFSIKALGGLGARQSLVKQNQTFQLLRQNVVRAMQGARMSDVDIALASQYIPNIGDISETIQTKLANLEDILNDIAGNTPSDQIGTSDWEEIP